MLLEKQVTLKIAKFLLKTVKPAQINKHSALSIIIPIVTQPLTKQFLPRQQKSPLPQPKAILLPHKLRPILIHPFHIPYKKRFKRSLIC